MPATLRQRLVLAGIVERAAAIESIEGLVVIGSFAGGDPDDLSDLDVIAVAAADRLDDAWAARHDLAGEVVVAWERQANAGRELRWPNWLTHDLVKVECGIAAPGARELAEPFRVVHGPRSVVDAFPRVDHAVVEQRAALRREQQRGFDPVALTPEERLGWKPAELKEAVRAALRAQQER